jgi:hypothetical protein
MPNNGDNSLAIHHQVDTALEKVKPSNCHRQFLNASNEPVVCWTEQYLLLVGREGHHKLELRRN